jgi:transposase
MVDACYVLRTGCAWTQLPKCFPSWLAVHKSYSRWAAHGKFKNL